jgi:hypothetical protein
MTDFALVHIKGGDKFDVTAAIATDRRPHDTFEPTAVPVAIVFYALHQGAGTIANARNRYSDILSHWHSPSQDPSGT